MWQLAETTSEGWRPGIGDPTFMGWFTVFAYFLAAIACVFAARRASLPSPAMKASPRFWLALATLFILLAINKQLDLQSWFTAVGRSLARRGGWYEHRGFVQGAFVITLACLGLGSIIWLIWRMRKSWRAHGLAVVGTTFIIFFIVIRAGSFHHVDELLGWTFVGLRMNWIFELGGIACVTYAAIRFAQVAPRSQSPSRSVAVKML